MKMRCLLVMLLLLSAPGAPALAAPPAGESAGEPFSFYGLRFGMTTQEVRERFKTNPAASEIIEPGHGIAALTLTYDYLGRLGEIRASYERPADRLRDTALRQALRERFLQTVPVRWRTVSVDLDETWNRGALTLVLVALDLRQEAIEHYKSEYLRAME